VIFIHCFIILMSILAIKETKALTRHTAAPMDAMMRVKMIQVNSFT